MLLCTNLSIKTSFVCGQAPGDLAMEYSGLNFFLNRYSHLLLRLFRKYDWLHGIDLADLWRRFFETLAFLALDDVEISLNSLFHSFNFSFETLSN